MVLVSHTMRIGLVLVALSAGLSACNTVEGVGEDIESAGDTLEDAAEDASN